MSFSTFTPRVLVLDADARFCSLIEHHVSSAWADSEIQHATTLDAVTGCAGDWCLVCDHMTLNTLTEACGETAYQWLAANKRRDSRFAPIIVAEPSNELMAVRYMKAGAGDFIPKRLLKHELIVAAVQEQALGKSSNGSQASPSGGGGDGFAHGEGSPAQASTSRDLPAPPIVAGYDILRTIGTGGMARIFLARSLAQDREVVLKVLYFDDLTGPDSDAGRRFAQENRLLASVRSPHVADIFDYGVVGRLCYMAMEYFPQGDLLKRMEQPVSVEQAVDYVRQIARALGQIHPLGIVHRDLKPANIMLRNARLVALIDFGMAKGADSVEVMTATGTVFGTPHYLSPEQVDGAEADARSDLYALGVVFFELLTGAKPFMGSTAFEVCLAHMNEPIPQLPASLGEFQGVVNRLLAKDRDDRFQSAGDLLEFLGTRQGDRLED